MRYIGIDISKDYLSVAFQQAGGWANLEVANTPAWVLAWVSGLDPACDWAVLEATGTYGSKVAHALGGRGVRFTQLSPLQSKGFLQAKKRSSHTDASDARALSEYGSRMQPPASEPPDEQRELLGQAKRALRQLRNQAQVVRNQAHALEQQAVQSEVSAAAYKGVLDVLEAQMCSLTDEEMAQAGKKLETIRGIGPAARQILLSTNGFKGFTSAKQAPKFVGLTPDSKQSGKSVRFRGGISRRGDPAVRKVLYMAALTASRCNKACKELYLRLKNKGKSTKVALVAVAHKLLRQAYGVLSSDKDFDNNHYLKLQET
jgi:transposase